MPLLPPSGIGATLAATGPVATITADWQLRASACTESMANRSLATACPEI
jgi:hypothetical protein